MMREAECLVEEIEAEVKRRNARIIAIYMRPEKQGDAVLTGAMLDLAASGKAARRIQSRGGDRIVKLG